MIRKQPQHFKILFLIVLLSTTLAYTQETEYTFKRLTVDDGLSQNTVYSILQDSKGFMWFGTKDGLNRYDGYKFTVFKHRQSDSMSLADNIVTTIFEDSRKRMWVGTSTGVLHLFDRGSERFRRIPLLHQTENLSSQAPVMTMTEDDGGNFWVATVGEGLFKVTIPEEGYDRRSFTVIPFRHIPGNSKSLSNNVVSALYYDTTGILWVGSDVYLQSLNLRSLEDGFKNQTGLYGSKRSRNADAYSVYKDAKGELWFGTTMGLSRYDRQSRRFESYPCKGKEISNDDKAIRSICEDNNGMFWLATFGNTMVFDPGTKRYRLIRNEIKEDERSFLPTIMRIYRDKSGAIWFGSNGYGLFIYDPKISRFQSFTKNRVGIRGWNGNSVRSLFEDASGRLWIGSYGGLFVSDASRRSFNRFPKMPGEPVRGMIQDRRGRLWFAAQEGLVCYDGKLLRTFGYRKEDSTSLRSVAVSGVHEDHDGFIWCVTPGVLSKLEEKSGRFIHYRFDPINEFQIADAVPVTIYQNGDNLWLTSERGLWRFNLQTKQFKQYVNKPGVNNSLSYNITYSLCADPSEPDRFLWIGTGVGLNRLDMTTDEFISFTESDGLPNNVVYGVLSDRGGNLWLSTNRGITKFNPRTHFIRSYFREDGLQSNEYNSGGYFKNKKGEMFFGGISGFDIFNPEEMKDNSYVPPVVLTELQLFNEPVGVDDGRGILRQAISETKSIILSYHQNVISLTFAALGFTIPEKNRYRYKLEGFNDSYIDAGTNRTATYTNLDPGAYMFHVQGTNNDGVWNEQGVLLSITVLPPYWMAWWFRSIVILLFLSVGPIIYWRRVSVLKKEQLQHELFTKKLIDNQESERKRIAAELHDSLGQTLLIIKNRALMGLNASKRKTKQRKQLDEISVSASEAIGEVREIAYRLRPYQLDRIGMTKAIKAMIDKVSATSPIKFSATIDPMDGVFPREEEINVYRIIQESVNNIIRHSNAGTASVTITRRNGTCSIVIQDDGIGLTRRTDTKKESGHGGFGMTGMAERVKILEGEIDIQSTEGTGTTISVTIPVRNENNEK